MSIYNIFYQIKKNDLKKKSWFLDPSKFLRGNGKKIIEEVNSIKYGTNKENLD